MLCFRERSGSVGFNTQSGRRLMLRMFAVATFALAITTSVQAMPVTPIQQDAFVAQVAYGCGAGATRVNGVCVARSTVRKVRRCARWNGGVCVVWRYY